MDDRDQLAQRAASALAELQQKLHAYPCHLPVIFQDQEEWARHYYGMIWSIGTIIVPASLAGLALDFRNEQGQLNAILMLMVFVASIALLMFWWLLANWHRKMGDRSATIVWAILAEWGFDDPGHVRTVALRLGPRHLLPYFLLEDPESRSIFRRDRGKALRLSFVGGIIAIWLIRVGSELIAEHWSA